MATAARFATCFAWTTWFCAFDAVREHLPVTAGQIYNVGGGPANTMSLLELIELIEDLTGTRVEYETAAAPARRPAGLRHRLQQAPPRYRVGAAHHRAPDRREHLPVVEAQPRPVRSPLAQPQRVPAALQQLPEAA